MYWLRLVILAFLACSCGSDGYRGTLRIGVDPQWYPLNFGSQTAYVNGYTEDLLLEMARYSGMQFELIPANSDTLFEGLKEKKYDAVFSSMPPYEYNLAKYDFSKNYLDFGPVLVLPIKAQAEKIDEMKGAMIGVIQGDQTSLILEKNPAVIIRIYPTIPNLLDAVADGEIQGAVLSRLPAANYVNDLYADRLKMGSEPLNQAGLHLVAPKGNATRFNKNLEALRKKKVVEKLLKKWQLN